MLVVEIRFYVIRADERMVREGLLFSWCYISGERYTSDLGKTASKLYYSRVDLAN